MRCGDRRSNGCGFTLVEALIALTITLAGALLVARLLVVSAHAGSASRSTTMATLIAAAKMEELRAAPPGAALSPPGAIASDTAGFVDYLDSSGQRLASVPGLVPVDAIYIRRWSIEPVPSSPVRLLLVQVLVRRARSRGAADVGSVVRRLPEEALIVDVRARRGL